MTDTDSATAGLQPAPDAPADQPAVEVASDPAPAPAPAAAPPEPEPDPVVAEAEAEAEPAYDPEGSASQIPVALRPTPAFARPHPRTV